MRIILTCKVGEKVIKTFEYDNEQIRKWSNKGILKCPVCGGKMVYKNGEFKIAHFAHESNECDLKYNEPESEEHLNGKKNLYEWLKTQDGISNLKLEAWIPETKQRPDIYFEYNNERYVIEYQCSPIATNYAERHRLYELAGIKDIWILGYQKYDLQINTDNLLYCNPITVDTKIIEREVLNNSKLIYLKNNCLFIPYLDTIEKITNVVRFEFDLLRIPIRKITIQDLINSNISDLENKTYINNCLKKDMLLKIENKKANYRYTTRKIKQIMEKVNKTNSVKNKFLNMLQNKLDLNFEKINKNTYCFKNKNENYIINFIHNDFEYENTINTQRIKFSNLKAVYIPIIIDFESKRFFEKNTTSYYYHNYNYINEDGIIVINDYNLKSFTKPFRGKKGGLGWNRIEYYQYDLNRFKYNYCKNSYQILNKLKNFKSVNSDINILLVDDFYKKPNGKKKYLKNFNPTEQFLYNLFNEVKNEKHIQLILPAKRDIKNNKIRYLEEELLEVKNKFNIVGYNNVKIYWG